MTVRRAEILAREVQLDRRRNGNGKKVTHGSGWEIRHGDFRQALDDLDDQSVDLIVTDPPYCDDALDLWCDLGELAARVLKPGRVLVALSGKLRLPEVIAALTEHLEWVWMGGIAYRGGHRRVRKWRIDDCWRPFVVLSAGTYEPRSYVRDLIVCAEAVDDVKTEHPWEQPLSPTVEIVEGFSKAGELVVDPMCGTGTTGLAAVQLGRRFLGVDQDKAAVSLATERLAARW
jgi:site-specific DNA-methyltransferase (adenine-specific)